MGLHVIANFRNFENFTGLLTRSESESSEC